LRDKVWWIAKFNEHAPGWPVEVVDKESLEQGDFPQEVLRDDGKIKVNVGSFTTMAWHGWSNIDIAPCHQFAQMNNYRFLQHDLRNGMPYNTACVDLIMMHHFLEHLTLEDGLKCLKDCRRVMRPEGVLRIVLPDVRLLADKYLNGQLDEYGEINDGCAAHHTKSGRFWSLVFPGHQHAYDIDGLCWALTEAGFDPHPTSFRQTQCGERGRQILKETQEMGYELSLFCEATPRMD
jgi:predicted SAM-dependent methyltransferase